MIRGGIVSRRKASVETTAISANLIYAGPASGAAAPPSFRSLVNADFPATLSPSIKNINLSDLNNGYVPYKSSGGLANSPLYTDGTNVGIGTTNPQVKLHLFSSVETALRIEGTRARLQLDGSGGSDTGTVSFRLSGSEKFKIEHDNTNDRLYVLKSGGSGLTLTAGGNVGIGTTSPSNLLHVYGTSNIVARFERFTSGVPNEGAIEVVGNDASNSKYSLYIGSSPSKGLIGTLQSVPLHFGVNSGINVTIDTSGNVGIGTTGPGAKLEVVSNVSGQLAFRVVPYYSSYTVHINQYGAIVAITSSSGEWSVFGSLLSNDSYQRLAFGLDSGEGFVGMGPGTTTKDIYIRRNSGDLVFKLGTTPSEKVRITSQGNVGILTTVPGGSSTVGSAVLSIANGTEPVGGRSSQVSLFSKDVSGSAELFVMDAAGNKTQLSPHPTDFLDTLPVADRPFPWAYHSENEYLGKRIKVDLAGLVAAVEKLTGQKFMFVEDIPQRSWDEDQEAQRLAREKEIQNALQQIAGLEQKIEAEEDEDKKQELIKQKESIVVPEPYVKKEPPKWIKGRIVIAKEATA